MSEIKCNTCISASNKRKIVRLFGELEVMDGILHGNGKPGILVRLVQLEERVEREAEAARKDRMTIYGDGDSVIGLCGKVKDCKEYVQSRKAWVGYFIAVLLSGSAAGSAAWAVAKLT